jgi:hypothetical protein
VLVAGTLTSHYAVNFVCDYLFLHLVDGTNFLAKGMPYKYVVSVDSKGFDQAPSEIMQALGRLTWATEQAVTAAGDEFLPPNELLTLAYFEDMSIGVSTVLMLLLPFLTITGSIMTMASHLSVQLSPRCLSEPKPR